MSQEVIRASAGQAGVDAQNPWLGLFAFTEDLQSFFHGRADETDELLRRVERQNLTVFFGQSGLGKSSLLQAGLFPRLRAAGYLPVAIRLDHDPAAPSLSRQATAAVKRAVADSGGQWQSPAGDEPGTLWEAFHRRGLKLLDRDERPLRLVLVFDQFEELFAIGQASDESRARAAQFLAELADLVENRAPASLAERLEQSPELARQFVFDDPDHRVLICLREDYLPHMESLRTALPSIAENRMRLTRMNGERALEAVLNPGGNLIARDVGRQVVCFVSGRDLPVRGGTGAAAGADSLAELEIEPSLLSLVCRELNNRRQALSLARITADLLAGSRERILHDYYERCVSDQPPGVRAFVEDELVTDSGLRENLALERARKELVERGAPPSAIDKLVQRRLLHLEDRLDIQRVELTHDVLTAVVKKSRDERHQQEATLRAEQEAHEVREKARRQRRRLRLIVAGMAVALTVVGGFGVESYRLYQLSVSRLRQVQEERERAERNEAAAQRARREAEANQKLAIASEKQAVAAKARSQQGFESAWQGLTALYDQYVEKTLADTPGISSQQVVVLKSKLRGHLLGQLRKLHDEQPEHHGTIQYIARLLSDEGADAYYVNKEYARADERLAEALDWSRKQPIESQADAETYADTLLRQAIVAYLSGGGKTGTETATRNLELVRQLTSQWPDSWRMALVAIRLEENIGFDDRNRAANLELAQKIAPLIERSGRDFRPVASYFRIRVNAFWGDGNFDRGEADYGLLKDLIVWFRENVVQNKAGYTNQEIEEAAERFENLVSLVQGQFSKPNEETTAAARREILAQLERTTEALESSHKSLVVYRVRGALLRLQEAGVKDGISTHSPAELALLTERHRRVAAAIGVAASVGDLLAPCYKAYTDDAADAAAKASALAAAQGCWRDFMSLDLAGVDTVLQHNDILTTNSKLWEAKPDDPMRALHLQMIDRYIALFAAASKDARPTYIDMFARATVPLVEEWFKHEQHEKVAEFAQQAYGGLPLSSFTSGDKSDFIRQLKFCICSLLKSGRREEARQLLNEAIALYDRIFAERPWDWYVKDAFTGVCFEVAAELTAPEEKPLAQTLLRRGWKRFAEQFAENIDFDHFAELPLKGKLPAEATEAEIAFFTSFMEGRPKSEGGITRFTIPTDFSGVKYPFHIYIYKGRNGYKELVDQFRWVKGIRGGTVPQEVLDSFERLDKIAVENNVSFRELCIYALGTAAAEGSAQQQFNEAVETVKKKEALYQADKNEQNGHELAEACNAASNRALFVKKWAEAEDFARKAIDLDAAVVAAYGNLATALLYQDKYDEALHAYLAKWSAPLNEKTLADAALADLEALGKAEIKCPHFDRVFAALAARRDASSAAEADMKLSALFGYLQWRSRGADAFVAGRYSDALDDFERAATSPLADASDHDRLGNCRGKLGRWKDAIAAYQRGIELSASESQTTTLAMNLFEALIVSEQPDALLKFARGIEEKGWRPPSDGDAGGYAALYHGFRAIALRMSGRDATVAETQMSEAIEPPAAPPGDWSWSEIDEWLKATKLAPDRKAAIQRIVARLKGEAVNLTDDP